MASPAIPRKPEPNLRVCCRASSSESSDNPSGSTPCVSSRELATATSSTIPTLVAGDVNPASRLTIGKRLGEHVALAYSQNLANSGFTMTSTYFAPAGISVRALLLDDQSRAYEFRHEPRFGAPSRKRAVVVASAAIAGIRFTGNPGFPESDLRRQLRLTDGDHFSFVAWQSRSRAVDRVLPVARLLRSPDSRTPTAPERRTDRVGSWRRA